MPETRLSKATPALLAKAIWLAHVPSAEAAGCRSQAIMASQCTWFALEELKSSPAMAVRAQEEATSDLTDGCSPKAYQMVLPHGTGLSDKVVARLQRSGARDEASVRTACTAAAARLPVR